MGIFLLGEQHAQRPSREGRKETAVSGAQRKERVRTGHHMLTSESRRVASRSLHSRSTDSYTGVPSQGPKYQTMRKPCNPFHL